MPQSDRPAVDTALIDDDTRLTTNRLARRLALHLGETQGSARGLLNLVIAEIRCALLAGRPVTLDGLGTLDTRALPPRRGVGPCGPWTKPAGVKAVFKAAKGLKEDLNAAAPPP